MSFSPRFMTSLTTCCTTRDFFSKRWESLQSHRSSVIEALWELKDRSRMLRMFVQGVHFYCQFVSHWWQLFRFQFPWWVFNEFSNSDGNMSLFRDGSIICPSLHRPSLIYFCIYVMLCTATFSIHPSIRSFWKKKTKNHFMCSHTNTFLFWINLNFFWLLGSIAVL